MYLKKVNGPRAVTLPDGTIMTRADLPDEDTRRWVADRKMIPKVFAAVVRAITYGLITWKDALDIYDLSDEELQNWHVAVERYGETALNATTIQRYRQP